MQTDVKPKISMADIFNNDLNNFISTTTAVKTDYFSMLTGTLQVRLGFSTFQSY